MHLPGRNEVAGKGRNGGPQRGGNSGNHEGLTMFGKKRRQGATLPGHRETASPRGYWTLCPANMRKQPARQTPSRYFDSRNICDKTFPGPWEVRKALATPHDVWGLNHAGKTPQGQDVSEHRRPPLRGSQHREMVVRPRQQHARPCSPRGPAERRGSSAQGHWSRHGRQVPAVPGRSPPPYQPICRAGSSRSIWRKTAAFRRSAHRVCGGGRRAGEFPDKRRKQSRRDLELHSCLRHTWGRLTDCRQSRPAPTAAKHRGLFYWPCYAPSPASRRAIRARISPTR